MFEFTVSFKELIRSVAESWEGAPAGIKRVRKMIIWGERLVAEINSTVVPRGTSEEKMYRSIIWGMEHPINCQSRNPTKKTNINQGYIRETARNPYAPDKYASDAYQWSRVNHTQNWYRHHSWIYRCNLLSAWDYHTYLYVISVMQHYQE